MATAVQVFWPFSPTIVSEWPGSSSLAMRPSHFGTDFKVPAGTPVPASVTGAVVRAGDDGLGAWCIDVLSPEGLLMRGGHFSRIDVRVGDQVWPGTIIGLSGGIPGTPGAGMSTGAHYHWELRWDRLWNGGRVVDPRTLNPQTFGASAPSRKDPDMARILNMRQTNDGKNDTATIFFDGGPGVGIKGISSPAHLVLLQRFIADKAGDHMFPAELAIIQTYLAPGVPTLTAATVEAAVAKAIKAAGGSVEASAVAAAVEATLKDDFAAIPASIGKALK